MKYLSFIENYKNMLGEIKGVSIDEIEYLENTFNLKFPEAYKEFLLIFGRDSGQLMPSYLMTINNLSRNIDCVKFDLENTIHSNTFKIEKNMFFFGQWQGSVFYFICNGNENPPVYFIQDFDKVEKYNESFSDFIRDEGLKLLLETKLGLK